ncbi:MAG: NAD(P)-dependent oxidoreductase [SAR202 cluster bacterium]|nr:NAD(P)-dependent oxidoreductase [SAR202 cluster bacterium]
MKVLLVGGAGNVGTWTAPYLLPHHELRVLDLRPPRAQGVEYVEGSIADPEALKQALDGIDIFVNMVMQNPTDPHSNRATIDDITRNYHVNTLGLHLLLQIAHEMGVLSGVCTSTFTVHARSRRWYSGEEEVPLDNPGVYGLTKGLGERICRYFCREFGMSIAALRITGPRDRAGWVEGRKIPVDDPAHLWVTDESDLASAYLAAIEFVRGRMGRFDAFFIAGDETGQEVNLAKANQLLEWAPKAHLLPPG